jgi:hypothetical protein
MPLDVLTLVIKILLIVGLINIGFEGPGDRRELLSCTSGHYYLLYGVVDDRRVSREDPPTIVLRLT